VANRFVRMIRSGEIGSVGELKSEFKELAKLNHPDLLGSDADGEAFRRLRGEYEAALRDFTKHRFGARAVDVALRADAGPRGFDAAASGPLSDEAWACLGLFLKRGFPKVPRHEKEALRYEYARWRLGEALGREGEVRFASCEAELLGLKSEGSRSLGPALALLRELIDYRAKALPAMRTQILLALAARGADPRIGPGYMIFVRFLAAELGIGMEIGVIPNG
jgi:hypothetical protein